MSLFSLREWWSTRTGDVDDCCATGCLASGRLLQERQRGACEMGGKRRSLLDQLIVGTHAGLICVYDPGATVERDASTSNARELNFKPSHVLVDCQLQVRRDRKVRDAVKSCIFLGAHHSSTMWTIRIKCRTRLYRSSS